MAFEGVQRMMKVIKTVLKLVLVLAAICLVVLVDTKPIFAQEGQDIIVIDTTMAEMGEKSPYAGYLDYEDFLFIPDPFCGLNFQAFIDRWTLHMEFDLQTWTFEGNITGHAIRTWPAAKAEGTFNGGMSGTIDPETRDYQGTINLTLFYDGYIDCDGQLTLADQQTVTGVGQVRGHIGYTDWKLGLNYGSPDAIHFETWCTRCPLPEAPPESLSVQLACHPAAPFVGGQVVCTAETVGKHDGEDLEYTWYLDSAKEADTKDGSWTWASAEKGTHDITVYVQGEGRDTESTVKIEVGEELELVASIGLDPPIPVVEKGVTFTPRVEGAKANETLSYRWFVDGNLLCETAACTWGEAPKGGHIVQLEVRGEGERIAVGQREFDVVTLVDEETAGFRIVVLGCNSGVSSDDTLVCSLGLERDEGIGLLNVTWLIDGIVASTESGVQAGSDMQLGQPAPGEHVVEALVVDPTNGNAISGQTIAEVVAGQNALIPPLAQIGAAGGTLGLVGVWLWAEWLNARRAEADEERLRALQKPSWVDDKRSLEEIWAAEVEAERQRRGLWSFEYNKETGIFKQPDWTYAEKRPLWWGESEDIFKKQQQAWQDARGDLDLRADRSLEGEWGVSGAIGGREKAERVDI